MNAKELREYKKLLDGIVIPGNLPQEELIKKYEPFKYFLSKRIPENLYRFRSCNENNFDALDRNAIFFSAGSMMNDDFEGMLYFDQDEIKAWAKDTSLCFKPVTDLVAAIKNGQDVPNEYRNLLSAEQCSLLKRAFENIQMQDVENASQDVHEHFTNESDIILAKIGSIIQNTKIACFSENINSAAMWGLYADSSKGFAVSYDFRGGNISICSSCINKCNNYKGGIIAPVIYESHRYNAIEYAKWCYQYQLINLLLYRLNRGYLFDLFCQNALCPDTFMSTKALLHKASAWKYEAEWRIIFSCNSQQINQQDHPFVNKVPSAVYLGRKIIPINEKIILQIAMNKKIPVYKMKIRESSKTYRLYPEPLYIPAIG